MSQVKCTDLTNTLSNLGIEILSNIDGYENLYLLEQQALKRFLVGKYINKYTRTSLIAIKDVYRTIQTINSNSLASVEFILELNGELFIIMEYLNDWCDLNSYIKKIYFKDDASMSEIKSIFFNIANVIDVLHTQNIIHGDIHGLNILVNKKSEIKIIDFDFAFIGVGNGDFSFYKLVDILKYNSLLFEFIFEKIYLTEKYSLFPNNLKKKEHFLKIASQHKSYDSCLDVFTGIFGINSL
jgi:serine/threonine protein kinase